MYGSVQVEIRVFLSLGNNLFVVLSFKLTAYRFVNFRLQHTQATREMLSTMALLGFMLRMQGINGEDAHRLVLDNPEFAFGKVPLVRVKFWRALKGIKQYQGKSLTLRIFLKDSYEN